MHQLYKIQAHKLTHTCTLSSLILFLFGILTIHKDTFEKKVKRRHEACEVRRQNFFIPKRNNADCIKNKGRLEIKRHGTHTHTHTKSQTRAFVHTQILRYKHMQRKPTLRPNWVACQSVCLKSRGEMHFTSIYFSLSGNNPFHPHRSNYNLNFRVRARLQT